MKNSLVTVIVPAYNASDYISETVQSIINQTYTNMEIIVVDDGSTDDTKEIIKSFGPKVNYIYQKNSGSCASPRNTGLRHARGEYVTFFDADDVMMAEKIEHQVADLEKHPDAVISISNYWNFTEMEISGDHFSTCPLLGTKIKDNNNQTFKLGPTDCREILLEENFAIASSPLFRAPTLQALGGFNESLKACEDFHLIYRTLMSGPALIHPTIGFYRRIHGTNMSGDDERMLRNLVKSRKLLTDEEFIAHLTQKLRSRIRAYNRALQSCLATKGNLKDALQIYRETMPPKNKEEVIRDLKNMAKIAINIYK